MTKVSGFVAYPAEPQIIGSTIKASLDILHKEATALSLTSWEENDIAGRFIVSSILEKIEKWDSACC